VVFEGKAVIAVVMMMNEMMAKTRLVRDRSEGGVGGGGGEV